MTPKTIFDALKIIYPTLTHIQTTPNLYVIVLKFGDLSTKYLTLGIKPYWKDITTYPPPEIKWRPAEWPRDASNPPKKCRIYSKFSWEIEADMYIYGVLVGAYKSNFLCVTDIDVRQTGHCEVEDI